MGHKLTITNGEHIGNHPSSEPDGFKPLHRWKLWASLVTALAVGQAAATLLIPRTFSLTLVTDAIGLLLMLSALLVFCVNLKASARDNRLFWALLATCWGVRVFGQSLWMYFEIVLRKEVPNPFVGDILLFLSNIPVLAALLLQPDLEATENREAQGPMDFLVLLLWWLYLYLIFVIPWQYVALNEKLYGLNYDRLNGALDIVLLLTLGFLWRRSLGSWKWFYAVFLAAQFLIAACGALANQAINQGKYYPGSWYDLPYSVALASFTAVGLFGLTLKSDTDDLARRPRAPLYVTFLGMLAVVSLPILGAWIVIDRSVPLRVTQFRELTTLGTMLVMALVVFAKQHRLRVELGCANQVLQEASLTDPLTGCRNRRFFDLTIFGETSQVLRSYASRQLHHTSDLILYMVDLDDFKEINDRYGHGAGDKVLTDMCKRIRATIRNSDILVRWGGDEFLIVSRNSNRKEAAHFAGRILNAVGGVRAAVASEGGDIHQSCSIGWAAFPWYPDQPNDVPLEAVLGLADRGVYEAKIGGKNRAVGISAAEQGAVFLVATGVDRVSSYCVQTDCVEGPPQGWATSTEASNPRIPSSC
jgi:diguanylate cyclase (GGDEF)-like protein